MYLSYYDLKAQPFQINTDPKFLWLGEKHQEAFATLKYGVLHNEGFLLLTGDVGTGKTTLINALIDSVGDEIIVAKVADPGLETLDFFNVVANAYNIDGDFNNKSSFLIHFSEFLQNSHANDKNVVLILDEAQRLSDGLLEEIRHLSNIERQNRSLLNIFFVGQIEMNDILLAAENRALRQRITVRYNLDPLAENEVGQYIRHRLKLAGSEKTIFTPDAINEIYRFSGGIPRLINIICDFSLLSGYAGQTKEIASEIVVECAEQLRLPNEQDEKEVPSEIVVENGEQPHEKSEQDYREQETILEIRQESVAESTRKPAGRATVYIGLLVLLLGIAGFFYYQAVHRQEITDLKAHPGKVTSGGNTLKAENSPRTVGVRSDTSEVSELQTQALDHQIVRSFPASAKMAPEGVSLKDEVSQEREQTIEVEENSSSSDREANLTESAGPAPTSQIDNSREEAPDSTEIIDWLLEEHSKANK